ncbi:MAG: YkvA family protein [Oscillospiraceae bacterium]|nr:YkvA family protein [Oscillospiraceae bacterium]
MNLIEKGAKAASKGTGKALELLNKASGKLEPMRTAPFLGDYVADIQDIIAMLNDYYHGRYRKLPFAVLAGALGVVAYLVSPIDLIPDGIPVLGFIDDAFIINIVLNICLDTELNRYRKWRGATGEENAD